jgi:hypothetical protein
MRAIPRLFAALALAVAAAAAPAKGRAAEAVDAAVVLAADVSRSINDEEFGLQRRGYAAAIASARLLEAIRSGPHGAIALCFVEWAGESEQKVVVDWAVIRNDDDARKFTEALLAAPRSYLGRTAIGSAIDFAMNVLGESGPAAERRVIDVSGDGTSNQGRLVTDARDAALKAGVVINGLAIFNRRAAEIGGYLALHTNPPGGLAKYYHDNVIGGLGAFVVPIDDFKSFGDAMIRKLVTEIAEAKPGDATPSLPSRVLAEGARIGEGEK